MHMISLKEASENLSHFVEKALNGDEVVIERDQTPLVKIVAIRREQGTRTIGGDKGLVNISDDFNAPLEEFKEYMS